MSFSKNTKNYTKVLASLEFNFPGLPKLPRAPDANSNRDLVDVYVAKKRLQLVHLLPVFDINTLRFTHVEQAFEQCGNLDHNIVASLLASGYSTVVDELSSLAQEEESLLLSTEVCPRGGRVKSFTENKPLYDELIAGLIACAESEKSDNVKAKVRIRKTLGEKFIIFDDVWLARQMILRCFSYLEFYDDDDLDKTRVELWCLLSYLCIYYEFSEDIGYDLPTKCLSLAKQVCRDKDWCFEKSVMKISVPCAINVYGLRNDWVRIKTDYMRMHTVVVILLHVLYVKKARYWQDELQKPTTDEGRTSSVDETKEFNGRTQWIKENAVGALTSALAYAEEASQNQPFITTTLRRGLFFQNLGEWDKAMEDFNAMHVLSRNFQDKESFAISLNRMAHNHKTLGNAAAALDLFAHGWELSHERSFEELQADALQDMGFILLEEGQTWEADECMTLANTLFRRAKKPDTPNDMDELTWAMMGVAGGQHILGRYATLIRTQEKSKIDAIYEWKMSRKGFPIASMPKKWYKTDKRKDFDKHYMDVMPSKGRKSHKVAFDVQNEESEEERRFFEFRPSEVAPRPTKWLISQGYSNMFGFLNASNKPRSVPRVSINEDLENDLDLAFREAHINADDDESISFQRRRERQARRMTQNMERNMQFAGAKRKTQREMSDWLKHDFRVKTWRKKSRSMSRWKIMLDPNVGMGERLGALLDDMKELSNIPLDDDNDSRRPSSEAEDESEDTELGSKRISFKKPSMNPELMEEFANFDDKNLGF